MGAYFYKEIHKYTKRKRVMRICVWINNKMSLFMRTKFNSGNLTASYY